MADSIPSDTFLSQADNDFEKISAPPAFDQEGDGLLAPADVPAPATKLPESQAQDGEVSTTTDNTGEIESEASEADQFSMIGASESDNEAYSNEPDSEEPVKPVTPVTFLNEPLLPSIQSVNTESDQQFQSLEEEEGIADSSTLDDFIEPSAPVPEQEEVIDPLIDFGSSPDPVLVQECIAPTLAATAPQPPQAPTSEFPELIPTDIDTVRDVDNQYDAFESIPDTVMKDVVSGTVMNDLVPELSEKSAEEIVPSSEECWLKGVDPRVVDLIYWRDVKKTAMVFGTMLTVLLCLAIFSLVSVLAYLSLALLTVSFSFVVYKKIMAAVQKSTDGHPFKQVLEMDITLKEDKLKPVIESVLSNVNKTGNELRRLFLIEDLVDSIKFGLMLWCSTYIGCCLNGITIVILAVILIFSVPKVYETYQVQIDQYLDLVKGHINNVINIVQSKLPFLKKKEKAL